LAAWLSADSLTQLHPRFGQSKKTNGRCSLVAGIWLMWVKHVKTIPQTPPLGMVYTTYKNGDDWGMAYCMALFHHVSPTL
jgi:hypothetical protein